MSKLATYTIANRPSASSNAGLMIFRTDTNNFEISDGTDWQTYLSDGSFQNYSSNSYSAQFDGTDDVVDISSLTIGDEFSYSAWFKFTGSGSFLPIVASGTSPTIQTLLSVNNSNQMTFLSRTSNTAIIQVSSAVSSGTWYHAVGTLDSSGNGKLYLNGSQIGSTTTFQTPNSSSRSQLAIGEAKRTSAHFEGFIDEVAIFNRGLTASEVQDIYNNKTYQSPQAMYRFENNFNDETGSYNGTQSGGVSFSSSDKPY
jgi:hypothetical protein